MFCFAFAFFFLVFVTVFSFLTTCIQLKILALHSADSLHPEWFCFLRATIHYICLSLADALAMVLSALNTPGTFFWPFKLETKWKLKRNTEDEYCAKLRWRGVIIFPARLVLTLQFSTNTNYTLATILPQEIRVSQK